MEYLDDLVRAWNDFRALSYSDTVLVAAGALVTLLALVRIVRSSVVMLFWVLLAGVGLAAVAHGSGRAPWEPRGLGEVELEALFGPGQELSLDALRVLCARLDESERTDWSEVRSSGGAPRLAGAVRVRTTP